MRIDIMFIMSLSTSDHFIHDSHDVAYVLIDSAETKTETKQRQKSKIATASTIRSEDLSLNIQSADYMTVIDK